MTRRSLVLLAMTLSSFCMASSDHWNDYIRNVEQAEPETLQAFPAHLVSIADSLNDERAEELTTAMSIALIKAPLSVIRATRSLEKSQDPLQQRFGTSLICSIPGMTHFTSEEIMAYFYRAEPSLKSAGPDAEQCLQTMRDTLDEFRQDLAQHPMK